MDDFKVTVRSVFRGIGQVMFQQSAWTGLLFWAGIMWGSYENGCPEVGWGALLAVIASTFAGIIMATDKTDGIDGLWGFNGVLVGCALPTFLGNTWYMWIAVVVCAMTTTWVRRGFNNVMAPWKVNSLTFPFVFMTWMFLLAARYFHALDPVSLSEPALTLGDTAATLDVSFGSLVVYWLKGIAQVFLVDSWVTGIFFLVGLAVCSLPAALWAAAGSAVALAVSILFKCDAQVISEGLFGFSATLTGIAVGCTFYKVTWRSALWALTAIVATQFIQMAMDAIMLPYGIPTLTAPFCITTWLFLLPRYKMDDRDLPDHSWWH